MISHRRTRPRRAGPGGRRHGAVSGLLALLAASAFLPDAAHAQAPDCAGLRGALDALRRGDDTAPLDMALRQQRDDVARTRDRAEDGGCTGDGALDDPDSPECRGLARRLQQLEAGLQRLEDQVSRRSIEAADRRRALTEQIDTDCPADGTGLPRSADVPDGTTTMPVDPDAPAPPDAAPAPLARIAQVYCVRHCDGAFYPLAVDVAADRLGDMDRICQAQCPAAESSAYAGRGGEDVSQALASDGTAYSALAAAFKFRTETTPTCACRAPRQSWAEALAGTEAMLEQHKGDVTVTPALAAAMARPAPAAAVAGTPKPPASKAPRPARPARRPEPSVALPPPEPIGGLDAARDLTRDFRRSVPTP